MIIIDYLLFSDGQDPVVESLHQNLWFPSIFFFHQPKFSFHCSKVPRPKVLAFSSASKGGAFVTWPLSETVAGWWLTYPSEKYEFVSWGYDIPIYICIIIYRKIKAMFQTMWFLFQPCDFWDFSQLLLGRNQKKPCCGGFSSQSRLMKPDCTSLIRLKITVIYNR